MIKYVFYYDSAMKLLKRKTKHLKPSQDLYEKVWDAFQTSDDIQNQLDYLMGRFMTTKILNEKDDNRDFIRMAKKVVDIPAFTNALIINITPPIPYPVERFLDALNEEHTKLENEMPSDLLKQNLYAGYLDLKEYISRSENLSELDASIMTKIDGACDHFADGGKETAEFNTHSLRLMNFMLEYIDKYLYSDTAKMDLF